MESIFTFPLKTVRLVRPLSSFFSSFIFFFARRAYPFCAMRHFGKVLGFNLLLISCFHVVLLPKIWIHSINYYFHPLSDIIFFFPFSIQIRNTHSVTTGSESWTRILENMTFITTILLGGDGKIQPPYFIYITYCIFVK